MAHFKPEKGEHSLPPIKKKIFLARQMCIRTAEKRSLVLISRSDIYGGKQRESNQSFYTGNLKDESV